MLSKNSSKSSLLKYLCLLFYHDYKNKSLFLYFLICELVAALWFLTQIEWDFFLRQQCRKAPASTAEKGHILDLLIKL